MNIPWIHVYTFSPCLYHESMSKHESMSIPCLHVYTMSPCQYQESMSITWVQKFIQWKKGKQYRHPIFRNILIQRGELHCVASNKSVWLFLLCPGHQRPVNDTRDMSDIVHSCLGCVSQAYSLWTAKLKLRKVLTKESWFSVSKTTRPDFQQSGNKTAKAAQLGAVRDLVDSAREGFMKKVHRRPWCQD